MIGDAVFLAGVALVTAGVGLWSVPAALVFAGCALMVFSFLALGDNGRESNDGDR